jgi:hypothetical protein
LRIKFNTNTISTIPVPTSLLNKNPKANCNEFQYLLKIDFVFLLIVRLMLSYLTSLTSSTTLVFNKFTYGFTPTFIKKSPEKIALGGTEEVAPG